MNHKICYRMVEGKDHLGIHMVVLDSENKVLCLSKYSISPRFNGNRDDFIKEIKLYGEAADHPIIQWNFSTWDYFITNGWDNGEIVTDQTLNEMILPWIKDP